MILADTHSRLLEHLNDWLSKAKGELHATKVQYAKRKPGVRLVDISFEEGRVSAFRDAMDLINAHIEQAKEQIQ